MTLDEITISLLTFLAENYLVRPADVDLTKTYMEQNILDSTGILDLLGFIEESWGFKIPDKDITEVNLGGVTKTAKYIWNRLAHND